MGWTIKEDSLVGGNTWNQWPRCLLTSGASYSKRQSNWWSVPAPSGTLQENCCASSAGSKGGFTSGSMWHHFCCVCWKCLYEDQESTAPGQLPRKGSLNVSLASTVQISTLMMWRYRDLYRVSDWLFVGSHFACKTNQEARYTEITDISLKRDFGVWKEIGPEGIYCRY